MGEDATLCSQERIVSFLEVSLYSETVRDQLATANILEDMQSY